MVSRVIAIYKGNVEGDLEKLVDDLFKYEKIVDGWLDRHPGYFADLQVDIDDNQFYTLSIECKKL